MAQWTDEQKKEVVRKAIEAFNHRDLDLYLSYHTEDATSWEVYFDKPLDIKESTEYIPDYWHAFPDAKVDPQAMYVSGDMVIVENVVSGTFVNEFLGQKPTGKRFEQPEGVFFELRDGKIGAVRIYMDRKTQEEQLEIG